MGVRLSSRGGASSGSGRVGLTDSAKRNENVSGNENLRGKGPSSGHIKQSIPSYGRIPSNSSKKCPKDVSSVTRRLESPPVTVADAATISVRLIGTPRRTIAYMTTKWRGARFLSGTTPSSLHQSYPRSNKASGFTLCHTDTYLFINAFCLLRKKIAILECRWTHLSNFVRYMRFSALVSNVWNVKSA